MPWGGTPGRCPGDSEREVRSEAGQEFPRQREGKGFQAEGTAPAKAQRQGELHRMTRGVILDSALPLTPHPAHQPSPVSLALSPWSVTSLLEDLPAPTLTPTYYWLLSSQRDSFKNMAQIVLHPLKHYTPLNPCLKHSRGFHPTWNKIHTCT